MNKLELFCVRVFMLLFVSLVPAHSNVQGDSLDIPLSMSVEGQLDTWFGDIATDGNYLFSLHNLSGETDSLNVFDLNDPLNPERLHTYLHHNSVSIYVHEHVYLTSDSGTVTVYHVGSGGELQLVSEYQSVNRITDMTFHHSLAIALPYQYPANEQSTRLELVDTSSPESPDLTGSVMIPGRAKALSPVFSGHYIAAATSAGWKNNGLVIIDISNPAEPVVVDSLTETRDPVDIAVDGNTLILALNGSGRAESLLKFYDIGDPLDVQTVSELVLDDDGFVSDLMMLEGTLFASLSSAGLITSHAWNPDQQTLQSGPSVATDFPMQMIAISDDRSGLYKSARTPDDGVTYTLYSGEQSEGVRIIKIRKPKTGENQVKLTLAITPAKAAEEGCEMSPPPGVYYYDPADEETVELSATPGDGWAFSHWIGPVPNTNPTSITVTEDTEVTAVFMPILTVTGRGERRVLCPDKALETEQLITPVNLMASQADDWTAVNITLKSRGAGDEQKDIENVILKRGQAVVATGSYSRDNGDIQLAFDPPLLIPQASTIRMNLYYQFDYDSAYAQDSVRTFLIETTDLTAMPRPLFTGTDSGQRRQRYVNDRARCQFGRSGICRNTAGARSPEYPAGRYGLGVSR
ncbi:MAG: hypothetical protein U5R06_05555 [candidate division KSB1 bacterium]|nr:hypothetical protein [candidate division KSB1 bacterium]